MRPAAAVARSPMNSRREGSGWRSGRGFTLVEILVVVVVLLVLAGIVLSLSRTFVSRARAAKRMSEMRQSGAILLAKAAERGGRCEYFSGGASGGFDLRAYNIVRGALGLAFTARDIAPIMHWDVDALPPVNPHWNCYGVNFQNVEDFGAVWSQESLQYNGSSFNVRTLSLSSVRRPESYPLLMDSSMADGKEVFRILESNNDRVGLRNVGKANASFLDGSGRMLAPADLKKAGFTKAFDNSVTPPKAIQL